MSLENKSVLITGASRGIGLEIAKYFAKENSKIVINYFGSEEEAKGAKEECIKLGAKEVITLKANVASFEESENLVKETIEKFGNIDILINNAGITKDTLMMRMKESDFDTVIDINLKGTWNMMKHVTRPMIKQKSGRIINISSVVGLIGNPGQINYVASKSGVIGMTKSLSKELGPRGITVNAVAPGFIKTAMTDKLSEEIVEYYKQTIPLGYLGEPKDIANAVLFLSKDESRYITGQVISVNGGMI